MIPKIDSSRSVNLAVTRVRLPKNVKRVLPPSPPVLDVPIGICKNIPKIDHPHSFEEKSISSSLKSFIDTLYQIESKYIESIALSVKNINGAHMRDIREKLESASSREQKYGKHLRILEKLTSSTLVSAVTSCLISKLSGNSFTAPLGSALGIISIVLVGFMLFAVEDKLLDNSFPPGVSGRHEWAETIFGIAKLITPAILSYFHCGCKIADSFGDLESVFLSLLNILGNLPELIRSYDKSNLLLLESKLTAITKKLSRSPEEMKDLNQYLDSFSYMINENIRTVSLLQRKHELMIRKITVSSGPLSAV